MDIFSVSDDIDKVDEESAEDSGQIQDIIFMHVSDPIIYELMPLVISLRKLPLNFNNN